MVLTFSWPAFPAPCHNNARSSQYYLGGNPRDPLIALDAIFRFLAAADSSVLCMTDFISHLGAGGKDLG